MNGTDSKLTGNVCKTGKGHGFKNNCIEYVLSEYPEFCTICERERRVVDLMKQYQGPDFRMCEDALSKR